MPTLPNLEFAGRTGNGDCLAEMDYRTGQILDAITQAGIESDTPRKTPGSPIPQ
jgi:hypothetical protein